MRGESERCSERRCADETETRALAAELAPILKAGETMLISGPLGVGKTTFVRGLLEALGYQGPVRSPTFGLMNVYEVQPPILHVDLYRVASPAGLGIEDYHETHLCLIEWPDRTVGWIDPRTCWKVDLRFENGHRMVRIEQPDAQP